MNKVKPLPKSWGIGDVWFDGVELRESIFKPFLRIENMTTQFQLI